MNNVIVEQTVLNKIKPRKPVANKGDFGRLLFVVTSKGMPGAGVLCASAALRSGAGLVRLAIPESNYIPVASQLAEPVYEILPENEAGTLDMRSADRLIKLSEKSDVMLLGCGLGCNEDTEKLTAHIIENIKIPLVLDADGINSLIPNILLLGKIKIPVILTPHPGEMSMLTGLSVAEVQADRQNIASGFSCRHGVILVLKGHHTIIALPDGALFTVTKGNPGMATGGSGDVLAGIIASLMGQGLSAEDAAVCGVYIHAEAGDRASQKLSQQSVLPTDIIKNLPKIFRACL